MLMRGTEKDDNNNNNDDDDDDDDEFVVEENENGGVELMTKDHLSVFMGFDKYFDKSALGCVQLGK